MRRFFFLSILFLTIVTLESRADGLVKVSSKNPILVEAESIIYNQKEGVVEAQGNVILTQGAQFVRAERVRYDKAADKVTAFGNVRMVDMQGHIVAAEETVLSNNFREGFIEKARLLLADRSRLVAQRAERTFGGKTELTNIKYTPCFICETDPQKSPLWAIRAARATQNGEKQHIEYRDAVLEVKGIPVLYTPYLRHPDPGIRRKSGFLTPKASLSRDLGAYFSVPYFFDLGPHQDMTLTPHLMSRFGPIMGVQARRHFGFGLMDVTGSIGHLKRIAGTEAKPRDQGNVTRWHILGKSRFDINDHWRWGVDLQRSSDNTYLKRFRFFGLENKNSLDSRAFAEGFYNRNYVAINNYTFQGLSENYQERAIPVVLPAIDINLKGEPKSVLGGHIFLDANTLSLYRQQGANVNRLVTRAGWQRTFISPLGDLYTLTGNVRGDLYHIQGYNPNDKDYVNPPVPGKPRQDEWVARAMPQLAMDWRYPWYKTIHNNVVTLQPIVSAIMAPNVREKNNKIPNEDSRLFDLDDSNLFSHHRFAGWDLLDRGTRINYGVQTDWYAQQGGEALFFLGKSYSFRPERFLPAGSGLTDKNSDYVGRLVLMPNPDVILKYKYRLHGETLQVRRSDVSLQLGPESLQLKTNYFYFNKDIGTGDTSNREQVRLEISSKPWQAWQLKTHTTRELSKGGKSLEHGLSLQYKNECVTMTTGVFRSFYHDRDVRADRGIFFRIELKNLGGM